MKLSHIAGISIIVAVLGACTDRHANVDTFVNQWLNQPLHALVVGWGVPDEELNIAGYTAVRYDRTYEEHIDDGGSSLVIGGNGDNYGTAITIDLDGPDPVITRKCEITFRYDEQEIIRDASWSGDGCMNLYGSENARF